MNIFSLITRIFRKSNTAPSKRTSIIGQVTIEQWVAVRGHRVSFSNLGRDDGHLYCFLTGKHAENSVSSSADGATCETAFASALALIEQTMTGSWRCAGALVSDGERLLDTDKVQQ